MQSWYRCTLLVSLALCLWPGCALTAADIHRLGRAQRYERIQQALRGAPSDEVRCAAAVALGGGKALSAIPDLVRLSQDLSPAVRLDAVHALHSYRGEDVYHALLLRLQDDNTEVSQAAEKGLRRWGADAAKILLDAIDHHDPAVRLGSLRLLAQLAHDDSLEPEHRLAIVPRVCAAVKDGSVLVRRQAAAALQHISDRECRDRACPCPATLYRLQREDQDLAVRLAVERALRSARASGERFAILPYRLVVVAPPAEAELAGRLAAHLREQRLCDAVLEGGDAAVEEAFRQRAAQARRAVHEVAVVVDRGAGLLRLVHRERGRAGEALHTAEGQSLEQSAEQLLPAVTERLLRELVRTE